MYKTFYNLNRKPFEIIPDPSFYWVGDNQKEVLSLLRYGILDNKGFLLLTGDFGVGKTSLIKALTKSFDTEVLWAVIDDPSLERIDFYNDIARNFGIDKKFTSKVQFLIQFSHFLHKADDEKRKVLLLVDECHLLSQEMLEELRLLSNIEKADTKLINIFFVGESSFNELLSLPKNRAVRQRLSLAADIKPLTANETEDYIRHRLSVAGAEEKIFSSKACQKVHLYAAGVPLQINRICDAALKLGVSEEEPTISPAIIERCLNKVDMTTASAETEAPTEVYVEEIAPAKQFGQFKLGNSPDSQITGFNLDADRKGGWLKIAFAALILMGVGGYFIKSNFTQVASTETTTPVVEQAAPTRKLPSVSASPAVTMLEKNSAEINKVKVDELKSAILEKAYNDDHPVQPQETVAEFANTGEVQLAAEAVAEDKTEAQSVTETEATPEIVSTGGAVAVVAENQGQNAIIPKVEEPVAVAQETPQTGSLNSSEPDVVLVEPEVVSPPVDVQPALPPLEPKMVILPLQPNSLKLTKAGRTALSSFVEKLKNYPKATILVKGFVSAKTNSPENIKLSEERALSIYKMLLADGIDPEQVEIEAMGNREPIASNNTREGRAKNRRVEILVITDGI
jgi:general secretion pathway protein A